MGIIFYNKISFEDEQGGMQWKSKEEEEKTRRREKSSVQAFCKPFWACSKIKAVS